MPTVVFGTDAFRELARAAATSAGVPQLPLVTVTHPLGGVAAATIADRAESVVSDVLAVLTHPPASRAAPASVSRALLTVSDDLDVFQELAASEGWSEGLPVLPPTPERVARVLGKARGDELVAILPPLGGLATGELIAVNAALAGAGPEHLSVVVAAIRALADPQFNLTAIQTTTHPCTPLVIVNGPIATRLDINAEANALGGGRRANAVIGRAVRLVLQNVGGARGGGLDRATHGHPGKFSYCVAEHEAASPWQPLHVERGFPPTASCVTVCASEAPHNVNDHGSTTAEALLAALAGTAATTGSNNIYLGGEPLVVLGPEHAQTIAESGWSKADFKRALWERARVRLDRFSPENLARFAVIDPERFRDRPRDADVAIARAAEDIMVIVAGGAGKHSAFIPTFGATRSVTVAMAE